MNEKKVLKIKWKNIIVLSLLLLCLITLIISLTNIKSWTKENRETKKQLEIINQNTKIEEKTDNENTIIIEQELDIPKTSPYWEYTKMELINVNFSKLKNINSNTVGWIQVNGTNINYPFVQTKNNAYYLDHSFDKTYNKAGWVFLDYRNNINHLDKNTILYAHSRLNETMFGSLKKTLDKKWLKNTDNHVIKISTEIENSLWQVFSIYHIKETSDYLKINFNTNTDFNDFSNMLIKRSIYDFKTNLSENDKILTLSTCYKEDERLVVHAKLIKLEKR